MTRLPHPSRSPFELLKKQIRADATLDPDARGCLLREVDRLRREVDGAPASLRVVACFLARLEWCAARDNGSLEVTARAASTAERISARLLANVGKWRGRRSVPFHRGRLAMYAPSPDNGETDLDDAQEGAGDAKGGTGDDMAGAGDDGVV